MLEEWITVGSGIFLSTQSAEVSTLFNCLEESPCSKLECFTALDTSLDKPGLPGGGDVGWANNHSNEKGLNMLKIAILLYVQLVLLRLKILIIFQRKYPRVIIPIFSEMSLALCLNHSAIQPSIWTGTHNSATLFLIF